MSSCFHGSVIEEWQIEEFDSANDNEARLVSKPNSCVSNTRRQTSASGAILTNLSNLSLQVSVFHGIAFLSGCQNHIKAMPQQRFRRLEQWRWAQEAAYSKMSLLLLRTENR